MIGWLVPMLVDMRVISTVIGWLEPMLAAMMLAFQKGCNCTCQRQARSAHCILIYDGRFPTLAGLSSFGREKIGPYNYPEREGKEEVEQTCVRYD